MNYLTSIQVELRGAPTPRSQREEMTKIWNLFLNAELNKEKRRQELLVHRDVIKKTLVRNKVWKSNKRKSKPFTNL